MSIQESSDKEPKRAELLARQPIRMRMRAVLRASAIGMLSVGSRPPKPGIHFPYYHHVMPDEQQQFGRQLDYLSRVGDFVSMDEAVALQDAGESESGTYFCITFDDGFRNNLLHAAPELARRNISACFFVVSSCMGRAASTLDDYYREHSFGLRVPFLSWDDCQRLLEKGMMIGSHTVSHARLARLDDDEAEYELQESKRIIEQELGIECRHFAAPWGLPDHDFRPERDPKLAKAVGYKSFLTTVRGRNTAKSNAFGVRRDNTEANWGLFQLKYFLGAD